MIHFREASASHCTRLSTCPYCIANRKQARNVRGHRFYVSPGSSPMLWRSTLMKRTKPPTAKSKGSWTCPDADFMAAHPTLAAHLCDAHWDDGTSREVSALTIRMGDGVVNVALTDYNEGATAFTAADCLSEALCLMEDALSKDKLTFRKWKGKGKK